jgi:hypothetical protein
MPSRKWSAASTTRFEWGSFRTIRRWLSALPQPLIEEYPHLASANAWALTFCQDFRVAAKVIEQLRRVNEDPRNPAAYSRDIDGPGAGAARRDGQKARIHWTAPKLDGSRASAALHW